MSLEYEASGVNVSGQTTIGPTKVSATTPLPVTVISGGVAALAPKGYQQISAATLAAATALTVPGGSTAAVVTSDTAGVRWRDDGTNPTAAIGMPIAAGQSYTFNGAAQLAAIKFILQSGSPVLNISYYG